MSGMQTPLRRDGQRRASLEPSVKMGMSELDAQDLVPSTERAPIPTAAARAPAIKPRHNRA